MNHLLALLLLNGCSTDTPTPEHNHEHHDNVQHEHGPKGDAHAASSDATTSAAPPSVALGSWTATLHPEANRLRVTATDGTGAPISPSGEIRVVLTGTGEAEQRIILSSDATGWSSPARAAGAPGYVAVLSTTIEGRNESARATWGEVPKAASARDEHSHDGQGEHQHDHEHGH